MIQRPRWTARLRQEVRRERVNLGFPSQEQVKEEQFKLDTLRKEIPDSSKINSSSILVIDIALAVRILVRQQKWRYYSCEIFLAIFLLVVLVAYALGTRKIDFSFFIANSVRLDLTQRAFPAERITFDLNTPLNTSEFMNVYGNGAPVIDITNLNPLTLKPTIRSERLRYTNCPVANPNGGFQEGICLRNRLQKDFYSLRNTSEWIDWLHFMLKTSKILTSQTNSSFGSNLILLGAIRLRQLRSNQTRGFVDSTLTEQTTPIVCQHAKDNTTELRLQSALNYRTSTQMNSFRNPLNPSEILLGLSAPQLSSRLSVYYPEDGFAWDFPRCNSAQALADWDDLTRACHWVASRYTSSMFLSFTGYDPVGDAFIYAILSIENFPQGTVITTQDIRIFRIPGGQADVQSRAYYWRIALCVVSLLELIGFIIRAMYESYQASSFSEKLWNRWLILDIIALSMIQAAVWLGISLSMNPVVQNIASSTAIAQMSSCQYTDYVAMFDYISYYEELQDMLLGLSLLFEGMKLFQLCQLNSRLSAAYSILDAVGRQLLSWFILISSIFFFFVFGASFIFGVTLVQFYTLPQSMIATFLFFSKVPKYTLPDLVRQFNGFSYEFWAAFEYPNQQALVWEINKFFETYEINGLFAFGVWFGLLVVVVFWIFRNLLIGIVTAGYEEVKRNIEAEEKEARERMEVQSRLKRSTDLSRARILWQNFEILAWKLSHFNNIQQFITILTSDPALKNRSLASYHQLTEIFEYVGVPEWYQLEFVDSFGFWLEYVDEAILLILEQERPLALSFDSVEAIKKTTSKEEARELFYESCRKEFASFTDLPFTKVIATSQWKDLPQATKTMVDDIIQVCSEEYSSDKVVFNVQKAAMMLGCKLGDTSELLRENREENIADFILTTCEDIFLLDFDQDKYLLRDKITKIIGNGSRDLLELEAIIILLVETFPSNIIGFPLREYPVLPDDPNKNLFFDQLFYELDPSLLENDDSLFNDQEPFNPKAQKMWNEGVVTGKIALSLAIVQGLRTTVIKERLLNKISDLERTQIHLDKQLKIAFNQLDDNMSPKNPSLFLQNQSPHIIEPHPNEGTFHVYYVGETTKFVGIFKTTEEGIAALEQTIQDEEMKKRFGRVDSEDDIRPRDDSFEWKRDDVDYEQLEKDTAKEEERRRLAERQGNFENEDSSPQELAQDGARFELEPIQKEDKTVEKLEEDGEYQRTYRVLCSNFFQKLGRGIVSCCKRVNNVTFSTLFGSEMDYIRYSQYENVWLNFKNEPARENEEVMLKPKTVIPIAGNKFVEILSKRQ